MNKGAGSIYENLFSGRSRGMTVSDIREAFKLVESGDVVSFAGGFPSEEAFPREFLAELMARVVSENAAIALQYGPTEGLTELRLLVADMMRSQGVRCDLDNVLITSGSQQALDLIAKILIDPGDRIAVEAPGYVGALGALNAYQPVFEPVPVDENGMQVELLEERLVRLKMQGKRIKALYTVPNFQNPSGVTMCLERRRRLVELAREYEFVIVEDNPYGELRYDGEFLPHLKSIDPGAPILYLGSFSKILIPGVRVAWIVGDDVPVRKIGIAKQSADLCTGSFGQVIAAEFIKEGRLNPHIERLRDFYRQRRDHMLAVIQDCFGEGVSWTKPQGGFFTWVSLPDYIDSADMLAEAVRNGVAYIPGRAFYTDGKPSSSMRLAFSQASLEEIRLGVERLAAVVERYLRTSARGAAVS